ncbi:MAG: hypothetical protein ACT4OF_02645 [Caulobacteraceae bacterium]
MKSGKPAELTQEETRAVRRALGVRETDKYDDHDGAALRTRKEAGAALKAAARAANRNDLAAAKQWSEVAKRLSETAEHLANTPLQPSWEEEEEIRAELRACFARYAETEDARREWLIRKEIWEEIAVEARRIGAPMPPPMPPPPPHWSDRLPEDLRRKLGVYVD